VEQRKLRDAGRGPANRKDTSSAVSALVIGKDIAAFAEELAGKNVAEVLRLEHNLLEAYTPDGYCVALKQVVENAKPNLVLFPHTYQVRDFAPKLSAMLGKGMIGDCIGYRNEGGKLVFVRQMFRKNRRGCHIYGSGAVVRIFSVGSVSRRFARGASFGKSTGKFCDRLAEREQIRTKPLDLFKEVKSAVDLTQAP